MVEDHFRHFGKSNRNSINRSHMFKVNEGIEVSVNQINKLFFRNKHIGIFIVYQLPNGLEDQACLSGQ